MTSKDESAGEWRKRYGALSLVQKFRLHAGGADSWRIFTLESALTAKEEEVAGLVKERDHWKANHDAQVSAKRNGRAAMQAHYEGLMARAEQALTWIVTDDPIMYPDGLAEASESTRWVCGCEYDRFDGGYVPCDAHGPVSTARAALTPKQAQG